MSLIFLSKFDGDTNDSIGGLIGTPTAVTFVAGRVGQAGSFNGTTSVVDFGDPAALNVTRFTIAAWVKSNRNQVGAYTYWWIAERGSLFDAGFGIHFRDRPNVGGFEVFSRGVSVKVASAPNAHRPVSQWNHIVGTYDGTNLRIYVNGILRNTSAGVDPSASANPFRIGDDDQSGANLLNWSGAIDDVRVYDEALSDRRIKSLFNNPFAGEPTKAGIKA